MLTPPGEAREGEQQESEVHEDTRARGHEDRREVLSMEPADTSNQVSARPQGSTCPAVSGAKHDELLSPPIGEEPQIGLRPGQGQGHGATPQTQGHAAEPWARLAAGLAQGQARIHTQGRASPLTGVPQSMKAEPPTSRENSSSSST